MTDSAMIVGAAGILGLLLLFATDFWLAKNRNRPLAPRTDRLILLAGVLAGAALVRASLMNFSPPDFAFHLSPWYHKIDREGMAALTRENCNYAPLYLYMVALGTYLPLKSLFLYKIIAFIFDLGCAFAAFRLVRLYRPAAGETTAALWAFAAVILCPTVIYNSAVLAQADAVFTAFLLLALYFMSKNRDLYAFIAWGGAFCIKLQSIFMLLPFLALFVRGRARAWHFLIPPVMYVISAIPNALAGRSFTDILLIYAGQINEFKHLTSKAPSIFAFMPEVAPYEQFAPAGIVFAGMFVFFTAYLLLRSGRQLDAPLLLLLALISAIGIPYLLPDMHERYFFPADLLAIIYAFYRPKHFWIPLVVIFCSLISYNTYLFFDGAFPLPVLALAMGGVLLFLYREFLLVLKQGR